MKSLANENRPLSVLQGSGMSAADAQLVAGHGSKAMTARYTHGDVERLRAVVDGLSFTGIVEKGRVM